MDVFLQVLFFELFEFHLKFVQITLTLGETHIILTQSFIYLLLELVVVWCLEQLLFCVTSFIQHGH